MGKYLLLFSLALVFSTPSWAIMKDNKGKTKQVIENTDKRQVRQSNSIKQSNKEHDACTNYKDTNKKKCKKDPLSKDNSICSKRT